MTSPPPSPQVTVVAEPFPSVSVAPSAPPASQTLMQPQMAQYGQRPPQQHTSQVSNQATQQQPQTHVEVKVAVPEGTVPGQQVFCTLPDGRRAMVVSEEHLEPGSSMTVRFPSQLPSQLPQSQPQQAQPQPPPLGVSLLSPLPETEVSTDDGRAATQYWWIYGLSWVCCCFVPCIGASMMFCMTVHFFCIKSARERASRPRQSGPAKVAAATLGAMCMCVALSIFVSSILYMACGENLHKCPGLSPWPWPAHHHHHGHDDHPHPGHHHGHGDHFFPGFDVPAHGKPVLKCQACLASGFDYCISKDQCTKRATFSCKGPHDHITGDKEFALHGNPHAQHSMTCPGSEVKASSDVPAVAESKKKDIVQEHKPCKMKKHLLAFASAIKSLLGKTQVTEMTATLVI
mmetsp:Transcript_133013/g.258951  ORF Transcript_133013/g.258951 Transcript_133013/m.258951 type:complete len:402 (-) Transcript_133013:274-1479(-)